MQNNNLVENKNNPIVTEADARRSNANVNFKMAAFYSQSTIVPTEYRSNASNCFIAIQMAERLGSDPLMVMQNLYVIKGRPSWSSKFIIGTINTSGRFKTPINYDLKGEWSKGNLECTCWAVYQDGTKCVGTKITQAMAMAEGWANKDGSKWKTMPEQMIRYRAASFFGNQFCPEILLGLSSKEELEDIIDIVPNSSEEVRSATLEQVHLEQDNQNASVKVVPIEDATPTEQENVQAAPVEEPIKETVSLNTNPDWLKGI